MRYLVSFGVLAVLALTLENSHLQILDAAGFSNDHSTTSSDLNRVQARHRYLSELQAHLTP